MTSNLTRPPVTADQLGAMTDAEATALVTSAGVSEAATCEVVHVALRDGVLVSARALRCLPESAHLSPLESLARTFAAGEILPEGIRPDILNHLELNGLIMAFRVPITPREAEAIQ